MYELFWWFWVDYTLKLLKPSGDSLASLAFWVAPPDVRTPQDPRLRQFLWKSALWQNSSREGGRGDWTSDNITKIAQGCQPGTRLILNYDTIPYWKMKRNFMHTLFWGTPLFWGSGYQTISNHSSKIIMSTCFILKHGTGLDRESAHLLRLNIGKLKYGTATNPVVNVKFIPLFRHDDQFLHGKCLRIPNLNFVATMPLSAQSPFSVGSKSY